MTGAPLAGSDPVLFDLDGTLTASGPGILASVRYALAEMREPIPDQSVLDRFIGPPLAHSFRDFCGMDPERVQVAIRTYREYFGERGQYENSVYDGIPELLDALLADGRVLAVATSKAEVYALSILDHFELAGRFRVIVGSELDGRRTDKAEVITEALVRLGRTVPAGAAMVGDRAHDVTGARATGLPCIGALWGYGTAAELDEAGADALADTPQQVLRLLRP